MVPEKNTQIESAEELEAEKQHLAEVKEDDIRTQIISEYGFNEDDDKERIDKLVQKEMGYKKSLSTAIGQKRKYRDEFTKLKTSKVEQPKSEDLSKDFDKKLNEALEKRDLEALDYPDDIKKAIAQVAKINETSVKNATSDPYVQAKIEAWNKKKEAEEAALNRTNKGGKKSPGDPLTPPDVDLNTEEGRKEYDAWKADMIKKGY